jgi:rubrerythrin
MMKEHTPEIGKNRTGVTMSDGRADAMERGMEEFPPSSTGTREGPGKVRVLYSKERNSLGSVPPPVGLREMAKSAIGTLTGREPTLFMDKLGERLVFERSGTRLYEALVSKHEAYGGFDGGPSREDLAEILNEELAHFVMLEEVIREQGGDPTAMTPSGDLSANAGKGLQDVIMEPRTTLLQSLEAILVAELADREGWETLIDLARQAGEVELLGKLESARHTEEGHLEKVRRWIRAGQGRSDESSYAAE